MVGLSSCLCFFFFNDTATTEIYTLSLHDALPICVSTATIGVAALCTLGLPALPASAAVTSGVPTPRTPAAADRKSTRLNSSHANISYAVFCLKKKKNSNNNKLQRIIYVL